MSIEVHHMIEKPDPEDAQKLAIIGKIYLNPDIDILERPKEGKGGEIPITDALMEPGKE